MRSLTTFALAALLAATVPCAAAAQDHDYAIIPRYEACAPAQNGSCVGCGANYVSCGSDTCYNPTAGETCCSNDYACPSSFDCSSTGPRCVPKDGEARGPGCHWDEGSNSNSTTTVTAWGSPAASSSATPVAAVTDATTVDTYTSVVTSVSGSSTTTWTTTITSTITNTVTINATTSSCDLSDSTTGVPVTSSMLSYGNTTTVALNTTTSTMSLANATVVSATVSSPKSTVSPATTGYKGAASALQGQSTMSLFVLGSLVWVSTLLL